MTSKLILYFFLIILSFCINSCQKESSIKTIDNFSKKDTANIIKSNKKVEKNTSISVKNPIYDLPTNPKTVKYELIDISSIKNLSKFSCDEINARYISLPNKEEVRLFLVPQDCGDFDYRYYLLTVKNNSVISDLYVEGIWQEPEDEDSKEITTFKIDHNFNIIVQTKLSDSTKSVEYRVTKDGKIVKI